MKYTFRFFLITLFLFAVSQFAFFIPLRSFFISTLAPVQYGAYSFRRGINNYFTFLTKIGSLEEEKEQLEKQVSELREQVVELKEDSYEKQILQKQLQLEEKNLTTNCQGHIVGTNTVGSELLINCGSRDGVEEGNTAVLGSYLLGSVVEVEKNISYVRLIIHPDSAVAVFDQNTDDRVQGIVQGQVGSGIVLKNVLPTANVAGGDFLVTSGANGIFPYGLLVGKIEQVSSSQAGLLKQAFVEPFVDFSNLTHIYIVSK